MKKPENQEERTRQLLTEPVESLIMTFAGPSIVSMLITSIYNMADTYFVSKLGTAASAAVGVNFSMMAIVQAFAFMIGQGSGNNMSRALGAGNRKLAETYVAVGFFTEFFMGTVLMFAALSVMNSLVFWLGATETIAPYAMDYARWVVLGFPFIMASFGMNNMLRFEGNTFIGSVGIMAGGILNMILDPVFIFGFNLGTKGAAIATTLSQMAAFAILLYFSNGKPEAVPIRWKNFRPTAEIYRRIVLIGLPSLSRQGFMSLSTIIFNHSAGVYGDACIAAASIVNRYMMLLNSIVIGIGQGFQPVCGQNLGAGKKDRVMRSFMFLLRSSFVILIVFAVASYVFAEPIVAVFRKEDADVIRYGTAFLRYQAVVLPLFAAVVSINMFTQTAGYGFRAAMMASFKNGICFIPFVLILPKLMGVTGLELSQPCADVLSTVLSIILVKPVIQDMTDGKGLREFLKSDKKRTASSS